MHMVRRSLVLIPLAMALFAAPAHASAVFVRVIPATATTPIDYEVDYLANTNEANKVVANQTPDGWMVTDFGAALTTGGMCVAIDAHSAKCTAPRTFPPPIRILTGDKDDTVTANPSSALVYGGDGNDVLQAGGTIYGGTGDDTITGGPDPDTFYGGAGKDTISGLGGNDTFSGDADDKGISAAPGQDDTIIGGDGQDTVTYAGRSAAVSVDLAAGTAVTGAEHDSLQSIEIVNGTDQADTLLGDASANDLRGGPGADQIDGRGGDDRLNGGAGVGVNTLLGGDGNDSLISATIGDQLSGGAGDDQLTSSTPGTRLSGGDGDDTINSAGKPAHLNCDAGNDKVSAQTTSGGTLPGCEGVTVLGGTIAVAPKRAARTVGLRLVCGPVINSGLAPIEPHCVGVVRLELRRGAGKGTLVLGRFRYDLKAPQEATPHIHLTKTPRKLLAKLKHPTFNLVTSGSPATRASWRVTL